MITTAPEIMALINKRRSEFVLPPRKPIGFKKDEGEWFLNENGIVQHLTGSFFNVELRECRHESREIDHSWDQPFITQVGFDGGILGQIFAKQDDSIFFLIQIKFEGGNYRGWQVTTTVQATFENLKRVHRGKSTPFADFFWNEQSQSIFPLDDSSDCFAWLSEDGGRLFQKRNLGILKQVELAGFGSDDEYYKWVSCDELKKLVLEDAVLSPHLMRLLFLFDVWCENV